MKNKKEKNSNNVLVKVLQGIIIFLLGVLTCFVYLKFIDVDHTDNNSNTEIINNDAKKSDINTDNNNNSEINDTTITNNDSSTNNNSNNNDSKKTIKKEFTNQAGKKIIIEGEKIESATGFSGASNHIFFIKEGNLYHINISEDNSEELIATSVKDLYYEDYEVYAELNPDGKIVKETNYLIIK